MFDSRLDTERAFEHHRAVERTYVRRRRTAVVLGTANVVGGFMVTDRMLELFKRKPSEREPQ